MDEDTPRTGADGDAPEPTRRDGPEAGADGVDNDPAAETEAFDWVDDGDWDPPNVEQRASDDAEAVSVGYVDMDEVIEPGDVDLENALFVALGVVGTVGLLFYVVQLAA